MKDTIILFDIDETLFDPHKYLDTVFQHIAKEMHIPEKPFSEEAWVLFRKFREKDQRFTPDAFAEILAKKYPFSLSNIVKIFWDKHIFAEALYPDVIPTIKKLSKNCFLGVLSTGDTKFQQAKIAEILHVLEKDSLHIFAAKEKELQTVLQKYHDKKIYFIDDREDILRLAKNIHPEMQTILIERKEQKVKGSISSLTQLVAMMQSL